MLANQEENRRIDVERLRAAGVPVWVTVIRTVDEAMASLRTMFRVALGVAGTGLARPAGGAGMAKKRTRPRASVAAAIPIWRDPWMVIVLGTFTGDIAAPARAGRAFTATIPKDSPPYYPLR